MKCSFPLDDGSAHLDDVTISEEPSTSTIVLSGEKITLFEYEFFIQVVKSSMTEWFIIGKDQVVQFFVSVEAVFEKAPSILK